MKDFLKIRPIYSIISGVNRLDDRTIQLKGDDLSLMWKRFTSKYQ